MSGAVTLKLVAPTSVVGPDFVQAVAVEFEYSAPLLTAEKHAEDFVDMLQLQDPLLLKGPAVVLSED